MLAIRVTYFILICYIYGNVINGWLLPPPPNIEPSDIHERKIVSNLPVYSMTINQNGNFLFFSTCDFVQQGLFIKLNFLLFFNLCVNDSIMRLFEQNCLQKTGTTHGVILAVSTSKFLENHNLYTQIRLKGTQNGD